MSDPDSVAAALLAAAVFAAGKHRDQRRKDSSASPYINHPLAVAEVLARHGVADAVALQAALLRPRAAVALLRTVGSVRGAPAWLYRLTRGRIPEHA